MEPEDAEPGTVPGSHQVARSWARGLVPQITVGVLCRHGGADPTFLREQGIRVLGTPLGHPVFVQAQLEETTRRHQTLLERILAVQDVKSAWALLFHCAGSRANYLLRVVP